MSRVFIIFLTLFLVANLSFSQTKSKNLSKARTPASTSSGEAKEIPPIVVGIETVNGKSMPMTAFKAGVEIADNLTVGGHLGFINTFDYLLIGPYGRYVLYTISVAKLYGEASLFYLRQKSSATVIASSGITTTSTTNSGILLSALGGIAITPLKDLPFEVSLSFGFLIDTLGSDEFSTVQNQFGNLGFSFWF